MKDILMEQLAERFEEAYCDDYELRAALAEKVLEHHEYYLYCKECAEDYLEDMYDEIYDKIKGVFFNKEHVCLDIRSLAEEAYGLDIQ